MAGSVNKVVLIGNVGKTPEVRRTNAGDPVVSFPLATTESWSDRNTGERKEKTEWHNIVVFNKGLAKIVETYVEKGSKLYLEGQLQTRRWQDKDGHDRYTTEVVLQAYRSELQLLSNRNSSGKFESETMDKIPQGAEKPNYEDELDDEIPF